MTNQKRQTQAAPIELERLTTEARNPLSQELDRLQTMELVRLINAEDAGVAGAVEAVLPEIAAAIDEITDRMAGGGRLIYVGAGTSGRLGVLDASECPPTFNADPEQVIGLIAGGDGALRNAVEGAEDSPRQGADDLRALDTGPDDVVVGIAASGRTPYVIGALDYARHAGAFTIAFSCNEEAEIRHHADLSVIPVVGPEILTGSTRMKAGTATKMVLNMLTTGAMVRLGKTYGNLMVDLQASNEKLVERSIRIVMELTGCSRSEAEGALAAGDSDLKTAVVVQSCGVSAAEATRRLTAAGGQLRQALKAEEPVE